MNRKVKGRPPVLTREQVEFIRQCEAVRTSVPTRAEIARQFNVSRGVIDDAVTKDRMHHVAQAKAEQAETCN